MTNPVQAIADRAWQYADDKSPNGQHQWKIFGTWPSTWCVPALQSADVLEVMKFSLPLTGD